MLDNLGTTSNRRRRSLKVFTPILAGATLRDRALACLGSLIAIGLTGFLCAAALGSGPELPLLIAPMGASAVLLFAVPTSPLAQPWPVIGGNIISALIGIAVVSLIHAPIVATGVAVALAIGVMSLTRSLHPPGGAVALMTALNGPQIATMGVKFALIPTALATDSDVIPPVRRL